MRRMIGAIALAALAVGACGKGDSGQSVYQAMQILCASDEEAGVENFAPAERQAAKSRWIAARLTNREVRDLFARMGEMSPQDRVKAVEEMVEKAQLKTCDILERGGGGGGGVPASLSLPELGVAAAGAVPLDDSTAMVTVVATSGELVIAGTPVIPLRGFEPDTTQLRTALSFEIVKVRDMTAALVAQAQASGRQLAGARILFPPEAPYRLLYQVLASMKLAGLARYDIVARRDGKPVAVPIALPEMAKPATAEDRGASEPLGLVVAVTKNNIIVFSISGTEGTLQRPKLATAGISSAEIARAQEALMEIHARHSDERSIVVMIDPTINMQLATETLAAVRARPDGSPLFSDVMLSAGFE